MAEGAKFCPTCGQATAEEILLCSQCGTRNEIQAKFCVACGSSLEDTSFSITEIPSVYEEAEPLDTLPNELENLPVNASSEEIDSKITSEIEIDSSEQKASRLAKAKALLEGLVNKSSRIKEEVAPMPAPPAILHIPKPKTEEAPIPQPQPKPIIVESTNNLKTDFLYELHDNIQKSLQDELATLKNDTNDIAYIQFTIERLNIRDVAAYSPFRLPEIINV